MYFLFVESTQFSMDSVIGDDDDDMQFFLFCAKFVTLVYIFGYYYSNGVRNRVHQSIPSGDILLMSF